MTTVAWDGKNLVADTQGAHGNLKFKIVKAMKFSTETMGELMVGGSGDGADIHAFIGWVKSGMALKDFPAMPRDSITMLVINKYGAQRFEASPWPLPVLEKFTAIGSGSDFAIGAMVMGADAEKALEIAKKYDLNTGGELTVLHF